MANEQNQQQALAEAKAKAAAAEQANAALEARIAELEARQVDAAANAEADSRASAKAKANAREVARVEDAKIVRAVVVSGTIQAPTDEVDSDGKLVKTEDGKVKNRFYEEGDTVSLPLGQARELRELGYVTIVR